MYIVETSETYIYKLLNFERIEDLLILMLRYPTTNVREFCTGRYSFILHTYLR